MSFFDALKRHVHKILLGQGRDFAQQRRHSRILCSIPVDLTRSSIQISGKLVDLSLEGGRVQVAAEPNRLGICRPPLRRGQEIDMKVSKLSLGVSSTAVTVRWIRPSTAGWDVGVQLHSGTGGWIPRLLVEYGLSQDAFHTRRTEARTLVKQKIQVKLGGHQKFPASMVDLSLGGAAIVSEKAFARFVPLELLLELDGEPAGLPAQVVHVRRVGETHKDKEWFCGVRFEELTRDQGELVGRHLIRCLRR